MSASKLIYHFSSHTATFGFWASLPPDNITSNPAKKRTDQSLSDFQMGIVAAAPITLNRAAYYSYQSHSCQYNYFSTKF